MNSPSPLIYPSVGPDGAVYIETYVFNETLTYGCSNGSDALNTVSATQTLSLLAVPPSGSVTITPIKMTTVTVPGNNQGSVSPTLQEGEVIPDGNGGILASWENFTQGATDYGAHIADVSGGGANDFFMPSLRTSGVTQMVLGDQGSDTAFAADSQNVLAFHISNGSTIYTTQSYGILAAISGDAIDVSTSAGLVQLDSLGQPSSPVASLLGATPLDPSTLATNAGGGGVGPWWKIANQQALVVSGPVMVPVSEWSDPAGEPQSQNAALPISIKINFTGSKTPADNLMFSNAQNTCFEALGLQDCTIVSGYRLWNLEGNARVYNDASEWKTVAVTNEFAYKGYYRDNSNNLQPFSCREPVHADGPQPFALQQVAGQKSIFYIDAPGPYWGIYPTNQCLTGNSLIDSMTFIFNFQVNYASKLSNYHRTVYYYVKIVIVSGGTLDNGNSQAGYGSLSLLF